LLPEKTGVEWGENRRIKVVFKNVELMVSGSGEGRR